MSLKRADSIHDMEFDMIGTPLVPEEGVGYSGIDMAFVVLDDKEKGDTRGKVIKICAPPLISLLKDACIDFPGREYQDLFKSTVRFTEPFVMLFYNFDRIRELVSTSAESTRPVHDKFLDFLTDQHSWAVLRKLEARVCRLICFSDLWLLYRPGTTVYRRPLQEGDGWRAFKVGSVNYDQEELHTVYYSLAFDQSGVKLVPRKHVLKLSTWIGERYITDLELVPANCLPEGQLLSFRNGLEKRGRKYWSFSGKPAYQTYQGRAWTSRMESEKIKVIVDYSTGSKCPVSRLDDSDQQSSDCSCIGCVRKYTALPSYPWDASEAKTSCPRDMYPGFEPAFANNDEEKDPRSPFIYCPSHVDAFSLEHRTWKTVNISSLVDVGKSAQLMDRLVLVQKSKWLLDIRVDEAIKTQVVGASGLTVMLQGPAGTGKSTTAKAISEAKEKPLYTISWPELSGKRFDDFTECIKDTLAKADNWGALLVIDKAETLLSSSADATSALNMCSSILMHKLERFRGVVFLLVGKTDIVTNEHIRSRINLAIQFPELNPTIRGRIWTGLVRDCTASPENKQALVNLTSTISSHKLNGHQLRNCLATALSLAKVDSPIQNRHIDIALAHDLEHAFGAATSPINSPQPQPQPRLRRRSSGQSSLPDVDEDSDNEARRTKHEKPSPPLRGALKSPSSPRSTIRNLRFETQSNAYPFPVVHENNSVVQIEVSSSMQPAIGISSAGADPEFQNTGLLSPRATASPLRSPLRSPQHSFARPRGLAYRPSMLRRHTTQSSLDAGSSDSAASGEWTWRMLPAHVRRPQLQFEKGLPDTDDEGREKGKRANDGDNEGGGRRGSLDKENREVVGKGHEKKRKGSQ